MAEENAGIDQNREKTLLGVTDDVAAEVRRLLVDATTGRLKVSATISGGSTPLTTKGDILTYDTAEARLPVGTDGQVLQADSAQSLGVKWATGGTGDLLADGTVPLTANWDVGAFTITGTQFISDIVTGTAPFVVSSTTAVANLSIGGNAATVTTITGLAPDTATTQATQPNITSAANLVTVGTIGTGTWQGTTIAVNQGGTGQTSYTNGQLLIGNTTGNTLDKATLTQGNAITITNGGGTITVAVDAASSTADGAVELATTAEIDTGTDTTRAMTPDAFQASKRNIRWLVFNLVEAGTDCATATNIAGDFVSPIAGVIQQSDTTPFYLYATNSTAGTTGTMVVDISIGGTSIMTTNKLDFDTGEKTTTTAATPPDLTTTALAVGDIITIDIDSIHTTAAKGLTVYMAVLET